MKVLLVNGSPNKTGCTYTALSEAGINTGIPFPERPERIATNFIR